MITVKSAHALFGLAILIISPVAASLSVYYNNIAALKETMAQTRLETAKTYASVTQLKDMNVKIDRISDDVAEIKGFMRRTTVAAPKRPRCPVYATSNPFSFSVCRASFSR